MSDGNMSENTAGRPTLTADQPDRAVGLVDRRAGSRHPESEDATVRLERQFADFDARLSDVVTQLEQQLRESSSVMIHQADAVARIIESAEVSVSLLARFSSEAAHGMLEAPPRSSAATTNDDGSDSPDAGEGREGSGTEAVAGRRGSGEHADTAGAPETRIAELSAQTEHLEAARAVAEAGNRAKSCFLAAMSREMRTPVDGVIRMIELLKQTNPSEEQDRYLRTASYSANALLSLLDSLLNISKVDIGDLDLRSRDFDLRRKLEDTVETLLPSAKKKGLQLTSHIPPEVPTLVRGEPGRLRQSLLFALHRTIQLATQGEVAVRAALEGTTETTATVRFTLHHAGTALSPEQRARAFASHAQIDGAPVSAEGGSGLGLAIARQMIELMGGEIGIDGDEIPGFTIWFTVPLDNYRKPADDRRAHGRLPQELLQCNLGPVLDLSMSGMRVRCTRAPKGEVDVELMDLEQPVTLRAEVMWSRRIGFRKFEVGLSFMGIPPNAAKQLTRISLNHRLRRLLGTA
ncbi:MAG: histidine kinase dimerization/phospho-acceptor domain-containing protein [Planctomycetota bacterium]|jgi:signal transduction histidine kinase